MGNPGKNFPMMKARHGPRPKSFSKVITSAGDRLAIKFLFYLKVYGLGWHLNEQRLGNAFLIAMKIKMTLEQATPYLPIHRKETAGKAKPTTCALESSPGEVHAFLQGTAGVICRSDSKDCGKAWSPVYETSLPIPKSAVDVDELPDARLVLAYHPTTKDGRSGVNWHALLHLTMKKQGPKKIGLENG